MLQPHLRASLGQRGPCWGELRPLQNKASSRGGRLKGQGIVVGGWATSFRENWPPSLEDWASFQGQEQSHKQETKSGLLHQAETGMDQEQEGHTCAQAGTTAPHFGSPVPVVVYLKGMERVIRVSDTGKSSYSWQCVKNCNSSEHYSKDIYTLGQYLLKIFFSNHYWEPTMCCLLL